MSALYLLAALACSPGGAGSSRAYQMQSLADGVGGPKAIARPGDFVLANDLVHLAVLGGRHSFGPGVYGGTVVDVDLQRAGGLWTEGRGDDRFAEMIPTVNLFVAGADDPSQVSIVADGSDGGPATVRVAAPAQPFLQVLGALGAFTPIAQVAISTDYTLAPGASWLDIRTTATVTDGAIPPAADGQDLPGVSSASDLPIVQVALGGGLAFGDFFLQGGSVDVFSPAAGPDVGGFDENGDVWIASQEGRNLFEDPFVLDFVAGTAPGVSYGLASLDGELLVPMYTSSQTAAFGAGLAAPDPCEGDTACTEEPSFEPGTAYSYERVLAVGHGDVGSVLDGILAARGVQTGLVEGFVVEEGSLDPVSGARVFVFTPGAERPLSEWTTDVALDDTMPDGSFGGTLPPGDWELEVHEAGRPTSERVPVTVQAGSALSLTLTARRSGEADFEVWDEAGLQPPSKVSIFRSDGKPVQRDPVLGDGYIAGEPEAVLFAPYGHAEARLSPGDYVAYATRGPEYELGVASFHVDAARRALVPLQVARSVDTEGWVSADFHVHASPSFDSGVSPTDRVITMAGEGVEFMVSSDHDYITDYAPVIEDLGLEPWISTVPGMELTTLELGHFIAFPLVHDYLAENGGAIDWWGLTPQQLFDSLRELADPAIDPVVLVPHPRDGILGYFDQYGLDPYAGTPGSPELQVPLTNMLANPSLFAASNFALDFDAMEIFNGKRLELVRTPTEPEMEAAQAGELTIDQVLRRTSQEQADLRDGVYTLAYGWEGQLDDWFALLDLGYRFTALGNSDTHDKTKIEAGCPRNFVASPTDDPAYLRPADIAEAVKQGRVVVSYGPFIRFWANDPEHGIGSDLQSSDPVDLYVEVQSPTWFDVDRVELYENGTLIDDWSIETPNTDILDLSTTRTVEPQRDSWYVVVAMGSGSMEPLMTPVEIPPIQLQDVVVDALSGVPAVSSVLSPMPPVPRAFPVHPYAVTNPIWIDVDGGGFDAPGLPDWLVEPEAPPEE